MATTTTLLQHPLHDKEHPLELQDFSNDSIPSQCILCQWMILGDGYGCEGCRFYAHRACTEAPPQIDHHPLHTDHPLTLIYRRWTFRCDACEQDFNFNVSSFSCNDCHFNLDVRCAMSILSDRGGAQGKPLEQIKLPFHNHTLTSFFTRHDLIGDSDCVICMARVEGDGYACLHWGCNFLIHKRCISDLYYTDGTKAPRIYHHHPLNTLLGEDMGSTRCAHCGSNESSGEFIGCAKDQVFYCRDCVQMPESIQYPHHLDHYLVLLISSLRNGRSHCDSCLVHLKVELCYGCPSCNFFVGMSCALQVLAYCGEGRSSKIELSWHEHQLHLGHRTEYDWCFCSYCGDNPAGPTYTCKEKDCELILHKRCTEIESTIIHPHHPDHPLTLGNKPLGNKPYCGACREIIRNLKFSCELCGFYLHTKCAVHFPSRKHPLHEHELLYFEKESLWKCNRCGTFLSSPFFRCVPCDLSLHEECMDLPRQVLNSEVHWHPLTLHETYIEDESGEYYCDKCEKSRDVRLGAYVCLQCSARWAYHIECIIPELRKVYEKKSQTSIITRFDERIARKNEEVCAAEVKLETLKRELDQLMKDRYKLISGEEHYETGTD